MNNPNEAVVRGPTSPSPIAALVDLVHPLTTNEMETNKEPNEKLSDPVYTRAADGDGEGSSTAPSFSSSVHRSISSPYLSVFPNRHGFSSTNSTITTPVKSPSMDFAATSSSSPPPLLIDHSMLMNSLDAVTRFAFADLFVTVLRLDFYKGDFPPSVEFCHLALELVLKWSDLPEKTKITLRHHLGEANGDDSDSDESDEPIDEGVEAKEEKATVRPKSTTAEKKAMSRPTSKPLQSLSQLEHLQPPSVNDDIGSLITTIKEDSWLKEHGPVVLMGSLLMAILEHGDYDSRYRVALRHMCALLGTHWDAFEELEDTLTDKIIRDKDESEPARLSRERQQRFKKYKRYALIGAATGVGGVLIGLTGGMAAPLIASGIGAFGISLPALALLNTTLGASVFGSIFGAAGAGLAGYRMQRRAGAIEEFVVEPLTNTEKDASLHCVLTVSGWIEDASDEKAFKHQWRHLWMSKEQYTLRYESKYLEEWGKAMEYFVTVAVSYAIQRSLMETALAGLISAITWPLILVSSSSIIDNPWNVCFSRAAEVGQFLAEILLARAHGRRPITLIGFSLGARVIYHCLLAMSKRTDCQTTGIVEDVVLLGAPVSASPKQWRQMCKVVGGRVINGYCQTDWLLRFLYRTASIQFTIAGTGPVDNRHERKIFNFNLSHIVKGHTEYAKKLSEILDVVGVRVTPLSKASRVDLAGATAEGNEAYNMEGNSTTPTETDNERRVEIVRLKLDDEHKDGERSSTGNKIGNDSALFEDPLGAMAQTNATDDSERADEEKSAQKTL